MNIQILFLSTSDKLKWTVVNCLTFPVDFPNNVDLFLCRLSDEEPLTWRESFEKLLSSQSKSSKSHLMKMFWSFHMFWGVNSLLLFSRWTVPVQSVPGLGVQRGEHCLLLGLWGLQGNKTFKTGHQSQKNLQRVHLLWCTTWGKYQITWQFRMPWLFLSSW